MSAVHLRVRKCGAKVQEQETIKQRIEEQIASSPASASPSSPGQNQTTTTIAEPSTPTKRGAKRKAAHDDDEDDSGSGSGSDDPFAAAIASPPSAKRQRRTPGQAGRGSAAPLGERFALFAPIPFCLALPVSPPSPEVDMDDFAAPPMTPMTTDFDFKEILPAARVIAGGEESMDLDLDVEQTFTYHSTDEAEDVVMSDSDEEGTNSESEKSEEMELECIPVQEAEMEKDWGLCVGCGGAVVQTIMGDVEMELGCSVEIVEIVEVEMD